MIIYEFRRKVCHVIKHNEGNGNSDNDMKDVKIKIVNKWI